MNQRKLIKLVVLGEPMGKQRPKFSTFNGYVKTYTQQETTNYENLVIYEYRNHYDSMSFQPHEQIVAVINAYFKIPKGRYKQYKRTNTIELDKQGKEMLENKIRPTKKPDNDNIAKICLDALNGIAYPDDSQIVGLYVNKYYSEEPRVEINLWRYLWEL